jgi:DNA repair exonuclease SbcCD ATPase subunit
LRPAEPATELARIEVAQRQLFREVETMRQEANAYVGALRSEVGQLKKTTDAAERLAQEAQKQLTAKMEQFKASSEEIKAKETAYERAIAALMACQSRVAQIPAEMSPTIWDWTEDGLHGFRSFQAEGNRSLRNLRLKNSSKNLLVGFPRFFPCQSTTQFTPPVADANVRMNILSSRPFAG